MQTHKIFDDYLKRWTLTAEGEAIITPGSFLLPVRYQEHKAMLKIAHAAEERRGAKLMLWWNGVGAAKVFFHDDKAILMERSEHGCALAEKARQGEGQDDEASRIICAVASKLHAHKGKPPELVSLQTWFKGLEIAAQQYAGIFSQSWQIAQKLLDSPQDIVVLHGDLHHGNILDFKEHGWLAIDPKGIYGERGFDFANIFCNPDKDLALKPGRLLRQAHIVAAAANLDIHRLLQWIFAYAGLSAAWSLEDGASPDLPLRVAEIAKIEIKP